MVEVGWRRQRRGRWLRDGSARKRSARAACIPSPLEKRRQLTAGGQVATSCTTASLVVPLTDEPALAECSGGSRVGSAQAPAATNSASRASDVLPWRDPLMPLLDALRNGEGASVVEVGLICEQRTASATLQTTPPPPRHSHAGPCVSSCVSVIMRQDARILHVFGGPGGALRNSQRAAGAGGSIKA